MRTALLVMLLVGFAAPVRADGPDFTREVRPILARHCFKCHGPDEKARKAKLRLDLRDSALKALAPGKPGESELVRRIKATDDGETMPPPHAKVPLDDAEKQTLERWIAGGAEYVPHWAFVAPQQLPPPSVKQKDWPRNPIDHFVLAKLEQEGLSPSPPADRYALVRRVYFDLIGLPPTPAEAEAFARDNSADAYEKLVDKLLASPHYGERWARRWLDLARYADTNGYEKDRPRSIWPWRDWVINALNADLPFDQFTIQQIAGDMLPRATQQQRIATGFHRNTMLNEEGGIDPQEFRFYAVADRVATTGTVWLGLTLGCAQCHAHKFDPLPHREYYQFFAFLNNADEPPLDVPTADLAKKRREVEERVAALVRDLPTKFPPDETKKDDKHSVEARRRENLDRKFHDWLEREAGRTVRWTVLRPTAKANLPLLTVREDNSVFASGDQGKSDTYDLAVEADLRGVTAIRLEVLPDDSLPRHGPGRVYYEGAPGDFFLCEFVVTADGEPVKLAHASHSFAAGGNTADKAIDGSPLTGWSIDGGQGRAHSAVFRPAAPFSAHDLRIKMLFERYYSSDLGRFRISVTTDSRPAEARDIPPEIEELLLLPADRRMAEQTARLRDQFLLLAPELAKERAEIEKVRKSAPADPTTLVLQERPAQNPRPTFIHNRGEFLQPTERVEPGVPSFLPPLLAGAPRNRLTFARWLVSPENPLVGRVAVNRAWAALFGRGLVRTTQDFGYTGEPPSHPELLDWFAVEFVKQGWSQKKLHKLIVMSATYRQASRATPELLAKDPENRLLARGPRVRLEAEMVRDAALRASGLLSPTVGGPSVFPPQPPGVSTDGAYGALNWKVSDGPDRYRRGLYTFTKRTAPFAMAAAFDAPSGEVCVARREVTNTPLQALTLLNDPVFVETAQALGRLAAAHKGTTEARVEDLFRRVLTRPPTREEVALLARFHEAQKRRFASKELDATTVAGPGEGDAVERGAWTAVARALLNLDEAIVKN